MYLGNSSDNELYKQPITIKRSKGATAGIIHSWIKINSWAIESPEQNAKRVYWHSSSCLVFI